jgi:hypothetical protein
MLRIVIFMVSLSIMLAGCGQLILAGTETAIGGIGSVFVAKPGPNPPAVVHSTEDSITVWYDEDRSDPLHEDAEQLVREHCNGPYTIQRTELEGSFTIEATCNGLNTSDRPAKTRPLP